MGVKNSKVQICAIFSDETVQHFDSLGCFLISRVYLACVYSLRYKLHIKIHTNK